MRYLITGGAGFIGSHLTDRLLEAGHHVHVLDDLSTGHLDNVRHWSDHNRFTLTVGSVLDEHALGRCVATCDRVVHLAAVVGAECIMERPVETIRTNVQGTENVLQLARHHGTRTLVASTSEVYGKAMDRNGHVEALSEEEDLTLGATGKRRWAYACSKAMDEFLARAYHDEHGLPVLCVRFFNTVGPRQSGCWRLYPYGLCIWAVMSRASSTRSVCRWGGIAQRRTLG